MTSPVETSTLPNTPSVAESSDPLPDSGFQPESITQRAQRISLAGRKKYGQHGKHQRNLAQTALGITREIIAPSLVQKASMETIPDSDLRPAELATRQIRDELMSQFADPTPMERHMVDMLVTDIIVVDTVDRYIYQMAINEGIVNRVDKFIYPIVLQAFDLKGMLARRMKMLGVKRTGTKTKNVMEDTLEAWRSSTKGGTPTPVKGANPKDQGKTPKAKVARAGAGKGKSTGTGVVVTDGPPLP